MQNIQLYIEGKRIELFKDESVTLTQSIQNAKDIGKVFTDFSKTFSVPATKSNNIIFKHYYNYHIVNGFDARTKKPAKIELNNLPFKDGKLKLEGVDLQNNKPYCYKVTFFGSTVELKDLISEDKLQSLTELTDYNQDYSSSKIKELFTDTTFGDIVVPLITHTQRLFYDSNSNTEGTGNLHYQSNALKGVKYDELKFAIRLDAIVKAIEIKYNISFSDDFFNSSNLPYYNLFMWLHRKKGGIENLSGENQSLVTGFPPSSDDGTFTRMDLNNALTITGQEDKYLLGELSFQTLSTSPYFISLQRNGVEFSRTEVPNGGNFIINDFPFSGTYTIYIESNSSFTFSSINWKFKYEDTIGQIIYDKIYTTSSFVFGNIFEFDITQQLPEMKTIDFLSGLFKTFNLTAFVEDGEIIVKTLDDFYAGGIDYDISEFIDVEKSSVNVALPYKEISFEHEDTNAFFSAIHKQKFGKTWGKAEYNNSENLDGTKYAVKTPFSQMKFERLIDGGGTGKTTIQWGYSTDDNQESYIGKPLIFYPIAVSGGDGLSFLKSDTQVERLNDYIVPSNSLDLDSADSKDNINFFNEVNEYSSDTSFTDTLFEKYYKTYIQDVFNPKNRLTKVTAYLPLKVLLNYTLADRFIINGDRYKINAIQTNLNNGVSELELLNEL